MNKERWFSMRSNESKMASKKCCEDLLSALVFLINVVLLILISVTYASDPSELAHGWKYHPRKPFLSEIPFVYVFGVGSGCIVTGITHTILFFIGKAADCPILMVLSIGLGILKELVSKFSFSERN